MLAEIVQRYEDLLSGKRVPEQFDEELFLAFYHAGMQGTSFIEVVHDLDVDLGDLYDTEYLAIILGGFLGHDHNLYEIPTNTSTH